MNPSASFGLFLRLGTVVTAVPAAVASALRSPNTASHHPKALEVKRLGDDGWQVHSIAISVRPSRAIVQLRRDAETFDVADNDLTFVVHAAQLKARLGGLLPQSKP